jgi:hypothetical protein
MRVFSALVELYSEFKLLSIDNSTEAQASLMPTAIRNFPDAGCLSNERVQLRLAKAAYLPSPVILVQFWTRYSIVVFKTPRDFVDFNPPLPTYHF